VALYPLSFSPKGERFCSFSPGGRLGWGFYMNKEKAIVLNLKNCYMNSEAIHSYRDSVKLRGKKRKYDILQIRIRKYSS
jgi:hypothetical protein